VFSTAWRSAEDDPYFDSAVDARAMPELLPLRCRRLLVGPEPDGVRVLRLVGMGMLELLGCLALILGVDDTELFLELGLELAFLAEMGVLSVDELLGVRFLSPPGVDVLRGTLLPKPTGVGRMPRAPDRMLLDRRTLEPRRPVPSSSELSDMLDPCRLGGREPGFDPGVSEWLRPLARSRVDWRRAYGSSLP